MKKLFGYILVSILLLACVSHNADNSVFMTTVDEIKIHYLNNDSTVYTRCIPEDTIVLEGRTFIKVYGVTDCKYSCPVLIEVK